MRVKSLSEIRKSKPFYSFDLLVYAALAFLLLLLFSAVVFKPKAEEIKGFYLLYENKVAAEYYFDSKTLKISDGYAEYFADTEDGLYFYPDGNSEEYNLILIDDGAKIVRITASTCTGHDCEKQKISASGGFIYCAPHNLKITAMGFTDPVTG